MPSNPNFRIYKGSYTSSEIDTMCATAGSVVFDTATNRIYTDIDNSNHAIQFGSNVADVTYNSTTKILTITHIDGTTTTVPLAGYETTTNKVTSLSSSSTDVQYPSAKCVYDSINLAPVVVWEVQSASNGILAAETDISQNPTWQITNLDMTPFKSVEFYIRAGGSANISYTPSIIVEVDLDTINKSSFGHFLGSAVVQAPNDRNRLLAVSVAVSEDKTSVLFSRCTSLYGTAATDANNNGRVLYKIVGYYA